jgi:glycosyltransferase involved in cell wall biosynthesis
MTNGMQRSNTVYILTLGGSAERAQAIALDLYPDHEVVHLSKRQLREGGWKQQLRQLRELKGKALVVAVRSREEIQEPLLLKLTILFHGCRETAMVDAQGALQVLRRSAVWKLIPEAAVCLAADCFVFLVGWVGLKSLHLWTRTATRFDATPPSLDVAFLYPFPMDRAEAGGAMSHVRGFLTGLAQRSAKCEIFSGRSLTLAAFPVREIPSRRRWYVFRESVAVSYNRAFVAGVKKLLGERKPAFLYQRHGRFVVAGALLAKRLRCPLVLEYNGSEVWITKHWDPTRFPRWLKLCEEISLAAASVIVVVSDVLREQLIERGIAADKIIVNPNAVDPAQFHPGCGGEAVRKQLGFETDDKVVGFIGTFSYWHGISVLQAAIDMILKEEEDARCSTKLRFLLIGDGPLHAELRENLASYSKKGRVVFTGQVSHDLAPAYLDSADILVSPHVPMPDGKPFFGSPTKLFEYMASGKAIVASDLDQLARVLTHQRTAWLVEPGNAKELAAAIRLLAVDPEMRQQLGQNAREEALREHTWERNAVRVLARFSSDEQMVAPALGESVA